MNEMVERIGLVIAMNDHYWCGTEEGFKNCIGEIVGEHCRCRQTARAVIAAMREPTEAMIEAGWGWEGRAHPAKIWSPMIDAALSEGDGNGGHG